MYVCSMVHTIYCHTIYGYIVSMPTQAIATRDAMAKALYGALFDWIVDQVSSSMDGGIPYGICSSPHHV